MIERKFCSHPLIRWITLCASRNEPRRASELVVLARLTAVCRADSTAITRIAVAYICIPNLVATSRNSGKSMIENKFCSYPLFLWITLCASCDEPRQVLDFAVPVGDCLFCKQSR
jgi:hypothetical protein